MKENKQTEVVNRKYEFTGDTKIVFDRTLHRISAVRDFGTIKSGDLGGWIESEHNLSHDGSAWVGGNAEVCGNARIFGNALVYGKTLVYGNALVYRNASVCGSACIYGNAKVGGKTLVYGNALIYGNASVCGNAHIFSEAEVGGNARIRGNVKVSDNALVCDDARIFGEAEVGGNARIFGNAEVKSSSDYMVFKNSWSSMRWFTYTASNKMWAVGCFYGTSQELIAKAYKDSKLSGLCYEAIVKAVEEIENAKKGVK